MEGVANFNIHAGKTTYVGHLTIAAGFMSDSEEKIRQAVRTSRGVYLIGRPEAFLTMRSNVTDMKG